MDKCFVLFVLLLVPSLTVSQNYTWICNFENDECEISQSFADDSFWFVQTYDGNRYYEPAINQVNGISYGLETSATFILSPASYPSSGRGVLSFSFYYYTDDPAPFYGHLTVTTCEGDDPVPPLGNLEAGWYFIKTEFTCGSKPVKISFTAVRGSSLTYIGVDNINVTEILTTTTEAVTSATSQVTRGQKLTPSILPSLTSSSIPTYTDSTTRHDMSTGSIPHNTEKGRVRSNNVIIPVISPISIVLLICLMVTGFVIWRKRYRPTPIEDKDSDDNGDKLYNNPVYSSHFQTDLLVGTPAGHLSQYTQQAHESIDEYEEFEGDSNRHLYSKPLRRQDSTGDNPTDIKETNLPGHAVLYDDEEYNALDFNRDKFPKTTPNCTKSQTNQPSLPGNSSETSTDDAFDYGVLECPGALGGDKYSSTAKAIEDPKRSTTDSKAPRYENSEPGVPSAAGQMEEGPVYHNYHDSLPLRAGDESSVEQARIAAETPREVDFEPIYSDEVYGDFH